MENVFADEAMIVILCPASAKMSMNAWPVLNLFAELLLFAKIFLEATSANVLKDIGKDFTFYMLDKWVILELEQFALDADLNYYK